MGTQVTISRASNDVARLASASGALSVDLTLEDVILALGRHLLNAASVGATVDPDEPCSRVLLGGEPLTVRQLASVEEELLGGHQLLTLVHRRTRLEAELARVRESLTKEYPDLGPDVTEAQARARLAALSEEG